MLCKLIFFEAGDNPANGRYNGCEVEIVDYNNISKQFTVETQSGNIIREVFADELFELKD